MPKMLPIATVLAALAASPALAAGPLPSTFVAPDGYRPVLDEPNGLRLLEPPGTLAGDRVIAGVNFRRASRRLGVTKVRVTLRRGLTVVDRITVKAPGRTGWRYAYLERPVTKAANTYLLRYTIHRRGGRTIDREFSLTG